MTTRGDALRARFPDGEHKTFRGRGNREFTYVEDETVMDRLDEVLGLGAWQWKVEPMGTDVVRGALGVRWDPGADFCWYFDFGYATNADSAEPLKEASTDAFRRCARLVGVARYVYAGALGAPATPVRPAPPRESVPPPAEVAAEPDGGPPLTWEDLPEVAGAILDANAAMDGICPVHREAWKHFEGTAKATGKPYDFWGCPQGRACKERPPHGWAERQVAT